MLVFFVDTENAIEGELVFLERERRREVKGEEKGVELEKDTLDSPLRIYLQKFPSRKIRGDVFSLIILEF